MIGLVHYHLRVGGVRRVMEAQAECLADSGRAFRFIVGEEPVGEFDFPYQVIEGLGYGQKCPDLKAAAPDVSIWHFHNPTLGKNASLTLRIYQLAQSGERLLMQLHDFAEDNRPENFSNLTERDHLYPLADHIHYAFINSRDMQILRRCGLAAEQSSLLGNRVKAPKITERRPSKTPLIFYPVRGIRRKNLGEAVLLALAAKKSGLDAQFAIALTADSPLQRSFHDRWQNFARELKLPIQFDAVNSTASGFSEWMMRCTHVMTTSIAEGFGMSFLEPSMLGIPVIGRNIPSITRDFGAGLDGDFYESIQFDLDDNWREVVSARLENSLSTHYAAYGRQPEMPAIPAQWDFGNLPEDLQESVIQAYLEDEIELRVNGLALAVWLKMALGHLPDPQTPERINERFGKANYEIRLNRGYDQLLATTPAPDSINWVDVNKVFDQFLNPQRFNFLRSQS